MSPPPRYRASRELARGGMGAVLLADDLQTGAQVALKVLLPGFADLEDRLRWRQEMVAGRALHHPGIVRLLDSGVDEAGAPWLVMELVPGESLKTWLARKGPLPIEGVLRIGVALADALAHAHEQGVLHRDLKPANVILRPDGRPVLIDLGLAKILNTDLKATKSLTETGEIMGTPAFMAPEQALGEKKEIGPWTDVYGLGATLYALLTGVPPIDGPMSPLHLLEAVTRRMPDKPRDRRSEIPADLEAVVLRCLAKKSADRYPAMPALGAALRACWRPSSSGPGR